MVNISSQLTAQAAEGVLEVTRMKYGLPIPNVDPGFKGLQEILDEERLAIMTPHENLMSMLQLDQ